MIKLNIYGSDTYQGASVAPASVTWDSSIIDLVVTKINLGPTFEGNVSIYADGHARNDGYEKIVGNIVTMPKRYPGSSTTIANYFPEKAVFQSNFLYIASTTYNMGLAEQTEAINFVLEGYSQQLDNEGNIKYMSYDIFIPRTVVTI